MEKFRKEIRELKHNNKKMQLQLTQCQKELRERDEFPIILPTLAARTKTARRAEVPRERSPAPTTEMDTSVGPSDWDDVSGLEMDKQHASGKEKEVISNMEEEMDIIEFSTTGGGAREEEGRRRSMGERGEPYVRASPPPATLAPPQSPRKGKEKEKGNKNKKEDIERRLEWLMEELANLRRDIRGETKNIPPVGGKEKPLRRKGKDKDYPPLPNQRNREEGKNNPVREVRWSTVVAR